MLLPAKIFLFWQVVAFQNIEIVLDVIQGCELRFQFFECGIISANPGLESRIQFTLEFPDYTREELGEIAVSFLKKKKYQINDDALNSFPHIHVHNTFRLLFELNQPAVLEILSLFSYSGSSVLSIPEYYHSRTERTM